MKKSHLLNQIGASLKLFTMIGILALALRGNVWGEAPAASGQKQQAAPAQSESAAQQPATATGNSANDDYLIGTSDVLEINVWQEKELTESVPVRSDGKISMPLIGEVQASGRTHTQLKEEITAKLRSYLTAPDVTVVVLQMNSRKFNVLGRVAKPGSYSLSATTTVLDAIAEAGGFQDFAKVKKIYILRRDDKGRVSHIPFNYKDVIQGKHPEENIALLPNDSVVVP
jgi:polysaccharide export outer membrane protein